MVEAEGVAIGKSSLTSAEISSSFTGAALSIRTGLPRCAGARAYPRRENPTDQPDPRLCGRRIAVRNRCMTDEVAVDLRTMGVAPCHHRPRGAVLPARQHSGRPPGCAISRWQLVRRQRLRSIPSIQDARLQRDRTRECGWPRDERTKPGTGASEPQVRFVDSQSTSGAYQRCGESTEETASPHYQTGEDGRGLERAGAGQFGLFSACSSFAGLAMTSTRASMSL